MGELADAGEDALRRIDFMEVAPENWIDVGGRLGERFRQFTERFPFVCHGLSLSLGGPTPLDMSFLEDVKRFLDAHRIAFYSEHLSACSDDGHLYDLMPIPFTDDAVRYVAERIKRVQDVLERRIGIENVSCYATPGAQMSELEFINAVLDEADCLLLLDVNNVYVNSVNFGYDPLEFLRGLRGERTAYIHIAGHRREGEDLRVDTHGAEVIDPVWRLLDQAYALHGKLPTLLERDFNVPPLPALLGEVETIRHALGEEPAALRAAPAPLSKVDESQPTSHGFQGPQREFAAYIRDPQRNPLPAGVEKRRANVYARVFYNNIESFLASAFFNSAAASGRRGMARPSARLRASPPRPVALLLGHSEGVSVLLGGVEAFPGGAAALRLGALPLPMGEARLGASARCRFRGKRPGRRTGRQALAFAPRVAVALRLSGAAHRHGLPTRRSPAATHLSDRLPQPPARSAIHVEQRHHGAPAGAHRRRQRRAALSRNHRRGTAYAVRAIERFGLEILHQLQEHDIVRR